MASDCRILVGRLFGVQRSWYDSGNKSLASCLPFGCNICYTLKGLQMGLVPVFYLWVAIMDVVKLVEKTVGGLGYELVDVERSGRGLLRVFIDKPEGIAVEDCQVVSNQLTRLFTVENIDYDRLEVSSPGLDRALKKEADFIRFAGQKVQIKLRMPIAARKNFIGIIGDIREGVLQMDVDGVQVEIELANVDKARLVPTF